MRAEALNTFVPPIVVTHSGEPLWTLPSMKAVASPINVRDSKREALSVRRAGAFICGLTRSITGAGNDARPEIATQSRV
jgi:hypothetical protein